MLFTKLPLNSNIQKAIKEKGYEEASPIQEQAIPLILEKKDVLAASQTGSGKTAAFTLPLLELISSKKKEDKPSAKIVILVPTRELAIQVNENIEAYNKYLNLKTAVIFGGVGINPQKAKLKKGVDIIIATPGRLLDHIIQKHVNLSKVNHLVLDEADRMLDMGFIHDMKRIISKLPASRQTLLFSATYSKEIKKLAQSYLDNPSIIEVARENSVAKEIKQAVYFVNKDKKNSLLSFLINEGKWEQVLVFVNTKFRANKLTEFLNASEIPTMVIHGSKSQGTRIKALNSFKEKEIKVLVATDIAARGIDIQNLPHVVNLELPEKSEDYVHRIGRTGRAGNNGEAISIVCDDEALLLDDIETLIDSKIHIKQIEGLTYPFLKRQKAMSKKKPSNKNSNQQQNKVKKEFTKTKNKKDNFQDQIDAFRERKKEYEQMEKRNRKRRVTSDSKKRSRG